MKAIYYLSIALIMGQANASDISHEFLGKYKAKLKESFCYQEDYDFNGNIVESYKIECLNPVGNHFYRFLTTHTMEMLEENEIFFIRFYHDEEMEDGYHLSGFTTAGFYQWDKIEDITNMRRYGALSILPKGFEYITGYEADAYFEEYSGPDGVIRFYTEKPVRQYFKEAIKVTRKSKRKLSFEYTWKEQGLGAGPRFRRSARYKFELKWLRPKPKG